MSPSRITITSYVPAQAEYFTNRYYTTDAWTAGGATMDALVAAHVAVSYPFVTVTSARIDDNTVDTNNYDTVSYNTPGSRTAATQDYSPLFVVARVDFDVAGGGSPSRKYLRGVLSEDVAGFINLSAGMLTILNTFADAVVAIGTICDPQGNLFVDGVPWNAPAMRQLRRGSKKKVTP